VAAIAIIGYQAVAFAHGAGYPSELKPLGDLTECSDHATAATPGYKAAIIGHLVFNRATVTHED
tara:strand:+ start:739 stop:930 length:192 start_codon:yes stop_codon:yes gene_type:complete